MSILPTLAFWTDARLLTMVFLGTVLCSLCSLAMFIEVERGLVVCSPGSYQACVHDHGTAEILHLTIAKFTPTLLPNAVSTIPRPRLHNKLTGQLGAVSCMLHSLVQSLAWGQRGAASFGIVCLEMNPARCTAL